MGIPGLTTFISHYTPKCSEVVYVRDCPIVIDGYNLMFTLYLGRKRPSYAHFVGGDYIGFASDVRSYFQSLKDCQIKPIVIMDGAIEDEKMETIEKRFQQLLTDNLKERKPGKFCAPVGITNVFLEILIEQRIAVFTTKMEADDTIAYIATRLKCPVLSSDSDFQVYPNLTAIPLNAVQFRRTVLKSGVRAWTLSAKIASLKLLCQRVFLFKDLRLVPLAALVLGNDRIPPKTFEKFLNWQPDKYSRMEEVFQWFATQRDYERGLATMMQSVKEKDRDAIKALTLSIVANYMGESGEEVIWNMVEELGFGTAVKVKVDASKDAHRKPTKFTFVPNKENSSIPPKPQPHLSTETSNNNLEATGSSTIPNWLLQEHYKSRLPDQLLKIIINRLILFYPQVEPPSLPSAHYLSLPIVQIMAGILLGASVPEIQLITRHGTRLVKEPLSVRADFPQISQSPAHNPNSRLNPNLKIKCDMICDIFELTSAEQMILEEWPPATKFSLITVLYFIKKLEKNEAPAIAIGIMLSFLKPTFESNGNSTTTNGALVEESVGDFIKGQGMSSDLKKFYNKFTSARFEESEYKIQRVYHYSQYQSILNQGMALNNLLGNPFKPPKFQVLDSYLIYNIMEAVLNEFGGDALLFIQTTLKNEITPIFKRIFEASSFKFDPAAASASMKEVDLEDNSSEVLDVEEETTDVLNRFGVLSLEDEDELAEFVLP